MFHTPETVLECFRAFLEAVLRARSAVPGSGHVSPPPSSSSKPRPQQYSWFNLTTERLDVNLHGLSNVLVLELADETGTAFETWSAWHTPPDDDTLLLTPPTITASTTTSSTTIPNTDRTKKMRAYFRLMVLLRTISAVACVLPGHEVATRVRRGEGAITSSLSLHKDAIKENATNSDEVAFHFPPVETERGGKFHVVVVHRAAAKLALRGDVVRPSSHGPEMIEDYLMATPARDPNPVYGRPSFAVNEVSELMYDEEEELQRWTRWTASSFDERERELAQDMKGGDEAPSTPPESPPMMGTIPRATSNPMAIPTGGNHSSNRMPSSNVSGSGGGNNSAVYGLTRHGSSNFALTGGHSISELVAFSTTGTPILSSLPFAVGSLGSSEASDNTPQALRARFLSGVTTLGRSPPNVFGSSQNSQRNLLLDAVKPSSVGGTRPIPTSHTTTPLFPSITATTTTPLETTQPSYGAALPWILSASEKENPFAAVGSSALGSLLVTDAFVPLPADEDGMRKPSLSREPRDIDFSDDTDLPFVASSDSDNEMGELPAPDEKTERETFLGHFVRRCRICPEVYPSAVTVDADGLRKELERLVNASSTLGATTTTTTAPLT